MWFKKIHFLNSLLWGGTMYDRVLREPHYYKVGMYIRLSQEDADKKYESDS